MRLIDTKNEEDSMKDKLKTLIKVIAFKVLYPLFRLQRLKENYVLFNSDNGKRFDGNTKAIYDCLQEQRTDLHYIVTGTENKDMNGVIFVKYMSIKYLYYLAVSKYWVVNINLYSGCRPRKKQVFLQTWHGTPLKQIGKDINNDDLEDEKREWLADAQNWSYFLSNAEISNQNYQSAFKINEQTILDYGLPRNDKLGTDATIYDQFRSEHDIPADKKILLYAPTYRDDGSRIEFDFSKFEQTMGDKYYLLVNFHRLYQHCVAQAYENIGFNTTLTINECMEISDALITDYSSVFFDYSMLNRPMFFYPYDYEKYVNDDRGTYFDYRKLVPGSISYSFAELCQNLQDENNLTADNSAFAKRFNANYESRNATQRVIDQVFGTPETN